MLEDDLTYENLLPKIHKYEAKGRGESASFLNWFLENIYRLDDTVADDSICDQKYDKGIDAIYVDHNSEEIHFFQSKLVQKSKYVGDVVLKEFSGTLEQFRSPESIDNILQGNANVDLKKLLTRQNIKNLLEKGYKVVGVFVCNQDKDENTLEFLRHSPDIVLYDRNAISSNFIEFEANEGIVGIAVFDTGYAGIIKLSVDKDTRIYFLPISATELVKLQGVSDGTLFNQNVRLSLGTTPVNKAIAKSVLEKNEHKFFPLYHNGITIICQNADLDEGSGRLTIENYVVVNGAQSLTTFHQNEAGLTPDLRVFVKIISLQDDNLARRITINSNNQNAIKPRDLRSNHDLMLRLQAEFKSYGLPYDFEIKRGEKFSDDHEVINNEEAGRLLLAFDLHEPYSCHQIYRVFDEKYAEIFGRPEVDAARIAFLYELMNIVIEKMNDIENKQLAKYTLTRFFILDVISHIMRMFDGGRKFLVNSVEIFSNDAKKEILEKCEDILSGIIVDLNYEIDQIGESLDYKRDFKSPEAVKRWRDLLLRSYEKDFRRGKAAGFGKEIRSDS